MKVLLIAFLLALAGSVADGQNRDQLFQRIQRKLELDRGYSPLRFIEVDHRDVQRDTCLADALDKATGIKGWAELDDSRQLLVYFLQEDDSRGSQVYPLVIFGIAPIKVSTFDSLYSMIHVRHAFDTTLLATFPQMYAFHSSKGGGSETLRGYVLRNYERWQREDIHARIPKHGSGKTSSDNTDFVNYAEINMSHSYRPPVTKEISRRGHREQVGLARRDSESAPSSPSTPLLAAAGGNGSLGEIRIPGVQGGGAVGGNNSNERTPLEEGGPFGIDRGTVSTKGLSVDEGALPYYVDLSFTHLSFSHSIFTSPQALGISGFGFELGFGDNVLNLVSIQSPYLSVGGRALIGLSGSQVRMEEQNFVELRVLGRVPVNSAKIIADLKSLNNSWIMSLKPSPLNVTPGFAVEMVMKRFHEYLPYVTFYFSHGSRNYADPFVSFGPPEAEFSYFSRTQWMASLSYFFNTDPSMNNRFKMELGAGSYDIRLVSYNENHKPVGVSTARGLSNVQALIGFDYTFATKSKETLFGMRTQFFDNRFSVSPWLKILYVAPHELRLESINITAPIGRLRQEWETTGGSMIQLRYRLGLH